MADDLATKLASAFTLAAGRMLPTSGYQVEKVTELLAADLRVIEGFAVGVAKSSAPTPAPDWYAGYDAGCRDQARADAPHAEAYAQTLAANARLARLAPEEARPAAPTTPSEALDRIAVVLSRPGLDYGGMLTDIGAIVRGTGQTPYTDVPPYECPHSDPMCPCLGPDHEMARDHAFQQGWDYEAERGDR